MQSNEFKGTPGPWRCCKANDGKCSCGLIWSIPADRIVATVYVETDDMGLDVPKEQRWENATLIARAPELLAFDDKSPITFEWLDEFLIRDDKREVFIVSPILTISQDEATKRWWLMAYEDENDQTSGLVEVAQLRHRGQVCLLQAMLNH